MKRFYCTYFDKAYLVRGISLITSLATHERHDFAIFVVCLDEITRAILTHLQLKNVFLIPLHEIEQGDEDLLAAKRTRSLVEYYWTLTPTIILSILERNPEVELLTYLDADLFFFSSPDPIFDELADGSVLIHEHRFPVGLEFMAIHGKFNVGLLCFRRDEQGMEVLRWWRARCNEWCYARVEDGKFGDQLYLEDWPERFKGIRVLEHVGAGLAPWNQIQYNYLRVGENSLLVEGMPVIFYHFHAFDFFAPEVVVLAKHGYVLAKDVVWSCYLPYVEHLSTIIKHVCAILPSFDFGLYANGVMKDDHAFLIRKEHAHLVANLTQYGETIDLGRWLCVCSNQVR